MRKLVIPREADPPTESSSQGMMTYSPSIALADNYTAWMLSNFKDYLGGRILEVGLGHGGYYRHLARYGDYMGLDIDPDAISAVSERYPQGQFVVGDVTSPDLRQLLGSAVDSIVCVNVLEHIEDDSERRAMAEKIALNLSMIFA